MSYDYFRRALKFLKVSYVVPLDDFLTLLLVIYFFSLLPYGILHTLSGEPSFLYIGLGLAACLIVANIYHIIFELSRIQNFIVGLAFSILHLSLMAFICFKSASDFIWIWFFPGVLIFYCINHPLIASFFSLVLIGIIFSVFYQLLGLIDLIIIMGSYFILCVFSYFLGFKICKDKELLDEFLLIDNITGLKNQIALDRLIKRRSLFVFIDKTKKIKSVIFIDIDNIKSIHHTYGYYSSDIIIQRVSKIIKKNITSKDHLYKLSNKGFVILSENSEVSIKLSDHIKNNIFEAPIFTYAESISISCGVAVRENDSSIETMINRADRALVSAKIIGGNRSVFLSKEKGLYQNA